MKIYYHPASTTSRPLALFAAESGMQIDFQVVDQQAGTSTVQLVACHRGLVARYLDWLREAGCAPTWIVPSSWGVAAWFQQHQAAARTREPVLLVNFDADHTDLVVVRQARVVLSRSLSQGVSAWETQHEALIQEIERSLSSLRKELPGVEVNSLVLTGIEPLERWKDLLEQRLGKSVNQRPATAGHPLSNVSSSPGISPAVVLGLAFGGSGSWINLLPGESRHARHAQRRTREFVLTASLVFAALLLGGA